MGIPTVGATLEPELIDLSARAFDEAMAVASQNEQLYKSFRLQHMQSLLASAVLEIARSGETDPEGIARKALSRFTHDELTNRGE
jgi:hypothetical protein